MGFYQNETPLAQYTSGLRVHKAERQLPGKAIKKLEKERAFYHRRAGNGCKGFTDYRALLCRVRFQHEGV